MFDIEREVGWWGERTYKAYNAMTVRALDITRSD